VVISDFFHPRKCHLDVEALNVNYGLISATVADPEIHKLR